MPNQVTTTTTNPPAYLQPFLEHGMGQARDLYNRGPAQYYPGQTVVGFSPETEQALGLQARRALSGSAVTNYGNNFATRTLAGGQPNTFGGGVNPYTGTGGFGAASNPHLDAMFNQAANQTQGRLQTEFAGGGRNLAAARPARAEELGNLATNIYGGAYESERNRGLQAFQGSQQIGAMGYESERDRLASEMARNQSAQLGVLGMTPQLAQADYADIDRLRQVGQTREDLTGRQYEDAANRWDFGQNAPSTALDQYLARLQGYPGAVSSTTTPIYRNTAAGALGGAMAGYNLGSQFGYGGWGALAGGLLGGWG